MSWFPEFFAGITAFGFWSVAIIVVEFIFLFSCTRRNAAEKSLFSGVTSILIAAGLLAWFSHFNIFKTIWLNPGASLIFFSGYFLFGAAWSLFKWKLFSREKRAEFDERYQKLVETLKWRLKEEEDRSRLLYFNNEPGKSLKQHELDGKQEKWNSELDAGRIPDDFVDEWDNHNPSATSLIPSAVRNKSLITNWIVFWPWSLLGYLLSDVISDIANWFFERLKGVYNWISLSSFSDADQRFLPKAKKP